MIRALLVILVACATGACTREWRRAQAERDGKVRDAAAVITADSVAALVPEAELSAAVARGDLRPVGVCGFYCSARGIELADRSLLATDSMNIVPGTSDAVVGPGVARLNAVADTYATRYNQLLIEHLKARTAPKVSGQGQ